ncbi:MAG: hypothetical protein U0234_13220 [Sandaracinus sp.]
MAGGALALLALAGAGAGARAQDATVARALDTECWSSPEVSCDAIGQARIDLVAGATRSRVRVIAVEVQVEGSTAWQPASDLHVMLESELVRSEPRHRRAPVVAIGRHAHEVLDVTFAPVRGGEGRVRVTLSIDGRRAVVEAAHTITALHE